MGTFLRDLLAITIMVAIAIFAGDRYFVEWSAVETSTGLIRLNHAMMMAFFGGACITMAGLIVGMLTIWTFSVREWYHYRKLRMTMHDRYKSSSKTNEEESQRIAA